MNISIMPLILFGVFLNTGAQLFLKAGVTRMDPLDFSWQNLMPVCYEIATNPFILSGLLIYVVSIAIWLLVLSKVEVSMAYPMISLGYILNAISAYYLFDESLSVSKMTGILVILCGVYLVARS